MLPNLLEADSGGRGREREREREREKEREGRGETEQPISGTLHPDFIVKSITRNGAMSESRVHPVISRYFFVREVTRLRENLAHSLSFFLSSARKKSEQRRGETQEVLSKTSRLKWWQHGGARRRLPRRGREGELYHEEESRGNTWKDRVIYCYGRLQHGVLVVCGCQGKKGGPLLQSDSFSFSRCLSSLPTLSRTLCRALRYLQIQIPDSLSFLVL